MKEHEPGSFGCHEALHLVYVFTDMFSRHIADHPAISQCPDWQKRAEEIGEALGDLYQAIGAKHGAEPGDRGNEQIQE
jgi:hypothetical protein